MVVTNGELGTIVTGVREGRRLHHNVASMIGYLLAGNLAEIFLVLVGLFLWPDLVIPLLPVHLLWINLVLDGIPAIALGVDRAPGDPLATTPARDGLLSRRVLAISARAPWSSACWSSRPSRSPAGSAGTTPWSGRRRC
ncbi:cation transporting ATPase C-terminal domain-containing protein [Nonomuraea thailandensis]